LFFASEMVYRADAQGVARGDGGCVGAVHPGQFLHRQDIGQIVQILAAVLPGRGDPEKALLGHGHESLQAELFVFIQYTGHRLDYLAGEIPDSDLQSRLLW
jgi:hypothetical protein